MKTPRIGGDASRRRRRSSEWARRLDRPFQRGARARRSAEAPFIEGRRGEGTVIVQAAEKIARDVPRLVHGFQ